MKQVNVISIVFVIGILVSACGATPAVPTINAVDVQNTAVAVALTLVAQTQAAIPTSTPLPATETPTETPPPTDTPQALPTLAPTLSAVPQNTIDPCSTRI